MANFGKYCIRIIVILARCRYLKKMVRSTTYNLYKEKFTPLHIVTKRDGRSQRRLGAVASNQAGAAAHILLNEAHIYQHNKLTDGADASR